MNNLMIFEGHDVEVFELNGQVLFNPYHVAEILDIKNVRDNISRMNNKQVVKIKNSDVTKTDIRKLNNAGENFLTESGVYKLVFKSHKPNAEAFTDWIADEVLPSLRKNGQYIMKAQTPVSEGIGIVKFIADDLRVNEASRLLMYENYCKDYGIPTGFIPKYEYNGGRQLKALTTVLKEHGINMSAVKFNQLLLENGFLEVRERNSSNGGVKKFKALTEAGLKYGENSMSLHNQKEVQPMYYSETFMDLYRTCIN